jgi:hypothetical protein
MYSFNCAGLVGSITGSSTTSQSSFFQVRSLFFFLFFLKKSKRKKEEVAPPHLSSLFMAFHETPSALFHTFSATGTGVSNPVLIS